MASLISPTSGTHQEIEIASKAARVILYDAAGNVLTALPVSGTVAISNFPATQPVSGTVAVSGTIPVSGTFYQATQPVSGTFYQATQPVSIAAPLVIERANLAITATGALAAAVTITLPAVASQYHNIGSIEIACFNGAARTGSATPVIATSTNLNGISWNFASAGAIGTLDRVLEIFELPVRSQVSNTATTIVLPATTGILWKVTVTYNTSV